MLKAIVMSEDAAMNTEGVCSKCHITLTNENTSEWSIAHGVCMNCVRSLGGGRLDDPLTAFLIGSYIMFTRNKDVWRIRVEVRSRSRTDLVAIKHMLGGTVYMHTPGRTGGTWRWAASAKEDVHRIGQLLLRYQPQLGMLLTQYVAQPNSKAKSAYTEACALKLGTRTVRILDHLELSGADGGLGDFAHPSQGQPVKED